MLDSKKGQHLKHGRFLSRGEPVTKADGQKDEDLRRQAGLHYDGLQQDRSRLNHRR